MPEILALDTNVYIQALRDAERLRCLKRFLLKKGMRVRIASVVALELRAGARTRAQQEAVEALLEPYVSRERVIVPTFDSFVQTGRVLAELSIKGGISYIGSPTRFRLTNDALLAASCREADATLITENVSDFVEIRRYLRGFRFSEADAELMSEK